MAKARSAVIYCAGSRVSSRVFAVMPVLLSTEVGTHQQSIIDIMPGPSRRTSWWAEDRSLSNLLLKFRRSEARFSRDRIYALLGICSDLEARQTLAPDYQKSDDEVARDAVAFLYSVPRVALNDSRFPFDDPLQSAGRHMAKWPVDINNHEDTIMFGTVPFYRSIFSEPGVLTYYQDQSENMSSASPSFAEGPTKRRHTRYPFANAQRLDVDLESIGPFDASTFLHPLGSFHRSSVESLFTCTRELDTVFAWAGPDSTRPFCDASTAIAMTKELAAAASTRYAWRRSPRTPRHVVVETAIMAQGRDIAAAVLRSELRREFGQGVFSILRIGINNGVTMQGRLTTGALATLLRHTGNPLAALQLLREQELVHAIPSSHDLVHALGANEQHGQQILHGILQDIIGDSRASRPQEQPDAIQRLQLRNQPFYEYSSPSCLSDFELLNIFTEFGHVEGLGDLLKSLTTHDQRRGLVLVTSQSMSLVASRRGNTSLPHAILGLSKIFNLSFTLSGLGTLITACNADELRALLRADTRTADLCRFLVVPSVIQHDVSTVVGLTDIKSVLTRQQAARIVFEIDTEIHTIGSLAPDIRNMTSQYAKAQDEEEDGSAAYLSQFACSIRTPGSQENKIPRSGRSTGLSALTRAAAMGDAITVEVLISRGAIISEPDDYGLTALMWAQHLKQQGMTHLLKGDTYLPKFSIISFTAWLEHSRDVLNHPEAYRESYHAQRLELEGHNFFEDSVRQWISSRSWSDHEN